MKIITAIGALFLVIFIVFIMKRKKYNKYKQEKWPFYKKKMLTPSEQSLYHRLIEIFPEYLVFAQVQLSQIIGVEKGNNYYEWYNKINRMSVDFVVCEKSMEIIAIIELDDKTHETEKRKETDLRKDKACKDAGIQLIRWKTKRIPEREEIKEIINNIKTHSAALTLGKAKP